jgi:hypothetical protein
LQRKQLSLEYWLTPPQLTRFTKAPPKQAQEQIPSMEASWGNCKQLHMDARVTKNETGELRMEVYHADPWIIWEESINTAHKQKTDLDLMLLHTHTN